MTAAATPTFRMLDMRFFSIRLHGTLQAASADARRRRSFLPPRAVAMRIVTYQRRR
jgi:hypothetical protein